MLPFSKVIVLSLADAIAVSPLRRPWEPPTIAKPFMSIVTSGAVTRMQKRLAEVAESKMFPLRMYEPGRSIVWHLVRGIAAASTIVGDKPNTATIAKVSQRIRATSFVQYVHSQLHASYVVVPKSNTANYLLPAKRWLVDNTGRAHKPGRQSEVVRS